MTAATPRCHDCHEGLAHCHGVLAVHSGDVTECLRDPDCAGSVEHHQDVVSCRTVFRACSCAMSAAIYASRRR